MTDDLSTNQTIVYATAIVGVVCGFIFLTKCTSNVNSTPEITQSLQTCQANLSYTVGSEFKDKVKLIPEPTPELYEMINKCRENVYKIYTYKSGKVVPELEISVDKSKTE